MNGKIQQITDRYYREFAEHGDFTSVPMSDDLRFDGPLHRYLGGGRYRDDCRRLAESVQTVSIRHQFFDDNRAFTVYDFDVGLPSGPIATSETLTFEDGVMVAADLYLDSTPLRPTSTES